MNANQRLIASSSIVLAVATAFTIGHGIGYTEPVPLSERVLTECEIKDVSESSGTTDDVVALLLDAGYYGIPFDGGEILYSPACIGEDYIP